MKNKTPAPVKGREAFPAVPPLLATLRRLAQAGVFTSPPANAGAAFQATSMYISIHPNSSGGNFTWVLPGGGLSLSPCLPAGKVRTRFGFRQATFLHHSLCGWL
jgi:hypothetical protein